MFKKPAKLPAELLLAERIKGSGMMVYFRWALIALLSIVLSIQYFSGYHSESIHAIQLIGMYALINILITLSIKKNHDPLWVSYASALMDTGIIAFHLYFLTKTYDPVASSAAATILLYPILILFYTFRLNSGILLFLTIIILMAFNLVYFHFSSEIPEVYSASLSLTATSQLFKTTYLLFIGLICIYFQNYIKRLIIRQIETNIQVVELQKANLQSQFQILKQQVNPHFLFNSLNVLISLIKTEPDLAEKFTGELSKVYRYVLENKDKDLVSLKTEIDFLKAYIFLIDIRFMGKVIISIEFDVNREDLLLLPNSLQLLIENAIKHNTFSRNTPLRIRLFIDENNYLNVENNLQNKQNQIASTGVGLTNIIKRYTLITDKNPYFYKTTESFIAGLPLLSE
jgi:sensor histidine kinase YesM